MNTKETNFWWIRMGYPSFTPDQRGFPCPGQVAQYYREHTLKDDGTSWTQADLSKVLGITVKAISEMENKSAGMDSIERRRILVDLFNIPPILMGIVTIDDISQIQSQQNSLPPKIPTKQSSIPTKKILLDANEYQVALESYWELDDKLTTMQTTKEILTRIDAIYKTIPFVNSRQEDTLKTLLCHYHLLMGMITCDQQDFDTSLGNRNRAIYLAKKIGDNRLYAAALRLGGETYLDKWEALSNPHALTNALQYFDAACSLEHAMGPQLRAAVLLSAGHAHALAATCEVEKIQALRMIDQGGSIVRQGLVENEGYFLKLSKDRYHIVKGSALIAAGTPTDAVDELALLQKDPGPGLIRRHVYGDILQAQAYAHKKCYPVATSIAYDTLLVAQKINSSMNIERIMQIYHDLKQSPYGKNPEVARLGLQLLNTPSKSC